MSPTCKMENNLPRGTQSFRRKDGALLPLGSLRLAAAVYEKLIAAAAADCRSAKELFRKYGYGMGTAGGVAVWVPSYPRKRVSRLIRPEPTWIPACAGMTNQGKSRSGTCLLSFLWASEAHGSLRGGMLGRLYDSRTGPSGRRASLCSGSPG